MGFGRAQQTEHIAAPHFFAIGLGVALGQKARGDFVGAGNVFHSNYPAAAVPIGTEADVVGSNQLDRVQRVFHEVIERRQRYGKFLLDGTAFLRHRLHLFAAECAATAKLGKERAHGLVPLGIGRSRDKIGAQ